MHELLERGDPTVANVMASHEEHTATVKEVKQALAECGAKFTRIRRHRFDDDEFDLVVTVGGDGTLLRASHSLGDTPVLGINSAPSSSVGFFCGARKGAVLPAIKAALAVELECAELNRMQVAVNGEVVHARVLNDALFCHQSPAATSRYIIAYDGVEEEQKSSGFWVGPAAGSTAAQRSAGGKVLPLTSKQLQLVVREPYTPNDDPNELAHVLVEDGNELVVRSKSRKMRLYLDGPDTIVRVTLGDVVTFRSAPEPLRLLGLTMSRTKPNGG
ncbi:MAG TPA: NAD(+) kinase [Polyangiaceae bacterium]|nr:NAD(+) kinase [Polyangiaceae bacterium]